MLLYSFWEWGSSGFPVFLLAFQVFPFLRLPIFLEKAPRIRSCHMTVKLGNICRKFRPKSLCLCCFFPEIGCCRQCENARDFRDFPLSFLSLFFWIPKVSLVICTFSPSFPGILEGRKILGTFGFFLGSLAKTKERKHKVRNPKIGPRISGRKKEEGARTTKEIPKKEKLDGSFGPVKKYLAPPLLPADIARSACTPTTPPQITPLLLPPFSIQNRHPRPAWTPPPLSPPPNRKNKNQGKQGNLVSARLAKCSREIFSY